MVAPATDIPGQDPGTTSLAPSLEDLKNRFASVLAIDFEATPDGTVFQIGAVLGDGVFYRDNIKDLRKALRDLSLFAKGAGYLLGHNIIRHDLCLAAKADDRWALFDLPIIDTLFLSPLAFPENPYHRLVKDYHLVHTSKNDPVADAQLARRLFQDQLAAFVDLAHSRPKLLSFFAFAFSKFCLPVPDQFDLSGTHGLFDDVSQGTPDRKEALEIFKDLTCGKVCPNGLDVIWRCLGEKVSQPVLAYLLSWLMVSGKNSIIPPWVKHQFPEIQGFLQQLRYACNDSNCSFCNNHNDSVFLLRKYFGFDQFRTDTTGQSLQKKIVDAAIQGIPLLGILPTGGGKSLCYQIPALHRYERLGELTIVISPLKALMKDQVDNLNRATGMEAAAAINGSLTLPERGAVMERVRLGDIGILYLSPEQFRNFSIASLIGSRTVGFWVFDEAHCLSKWGHDFRPDYLFVSQFISQYADAAGTRPLVGAFTATAKQDVVQEIVCHFSENLSLDLIDFPGGVERPNLNYEVWPVTKNEKDDLIIATLKERLTKESSSAIVYCATRKNTENLSRLLNERGVRAEAFHAGRSEPDKRNIQDDFIEGKIPVICATNAFGMGIDKKDIRLVIHADIPGSLENYLQEAGRAGRDQMPSDCILLYEEEDIQNQFALNAYSRLSIKDIKKILKKLKEKGAKTPDIIITPAEIMRLIGYGDDALDDTRARTGVAWLERKGFVERTHNRTFFFNGVPGVKNMEDAHKRMDRLTLSKMTKSIYTTVLGHLFSADPNALISADDISLSLGRIENLPEKYADSRQIMALLADMAQAGLVQEGMSLTAFVRPKGKGNSPFLLDYFSRAEIQMLGIMEEMAPDSGASPDSADVFNLRLMSQRLKDKGFDTITPDQVESMLRAMAGDKGANSGKSLKISGRAGTDQRYVHVKFPWQKIGKRVGLRHGVSRQVLDVIISRLPAALRNGQAEVLSQFFFTDLMAGMGGDVFLSGFQGDVKAMIEKSLLFLHDMKIIVLQNGLGVFRQAMTLKVLPEAVNRQYTKGDYEPLSLHYAQKNVQVHVMERYARLGIEKIRTAVKFVSDYFSSSHEAFIRQYFSGQEEIIHTAMTADLFRKIIQSLENHRQEAVIAADPETNILVLAGPGSGKTRTIVHRCAWLIKARSVNPAAILVLCFNHHAMVDLKKRIKTLVGKGASQVTTMTFHGFAMRLTGRSFLDGPRRDKDTRLEKDIGFDTVLGEAVDILTGNRQVAGSSPSEVREQLLAQYRYILVDEYQDIDQTQYAFISALTGRLEQDIESRVAIMAVGDDDQSIYKFRNANVAFIRQFKLDYGAKTHYLLENYRSSHPIIQVANAFIAQNQNRMKQDRAITINQKRKLGKRAVERLATGELVQMVHVLDIPSQAVCVAKKIKAILRENPFARPKDMAVVSRFGISHPLLVSVRMALARERIDFCYTIKGGNGRMGFPIFRLREFRTLLSFLEDHQKESIRPEVLKTDVLGNFPVKNAWTDQVADILDAWCRINPDREISLSRARDFVLEFLLEERKEHKTGNGVFLGTVHSVKGRQFPHVFILDGGWESPEDMEEERRLYYVGMTRAMENLYLFLLETGSNPHTDFLRAHPFVHETRAKAAALPGYSKELTVSVLGLESLYINYPGLFLAASPLHGRLRKLAAGERVFFKRLQDQVFIVNEQGQKLARMSQNACLKWQNALDRIKTARVLGMVLRRKTDDQDQSFGTPLCDAWELPMIEILHEQR